MNTTCKTSASRFIVPFGMILSVALGCGDSASKQDAIVQGTVTIDGELVGQGIVTFHPESEGPVAYGTILKDGTYALRIGKGQKQERDNKIFPGKYTATVAVTMPSPASQDDEEDEGIRKPGPRLSDAKFSNKATSELKYDVASGRNIINISVERAQPEEEVGAEEESEAEAEAEEEVEVEEAEEETETAPTQENQPQAVEQETESTDDSQEPPPSDEEASSDTVKEEPAE